MSLRWLGAVLRGHSLLLPRWRREFSFLCPFSLFLRRLSKFSKKKDLDRSKGAARRITIIAGLTNTLMRNKGPKNGGKDSFGSPPKKKKKTRKRTASEPSQESPRHNTTFFYVFSNNHTCFFSFFGSPFFIFTIFLLFSTNLPCPDK